jgi:hypothetical protein
MSMEKYLLPWEYSGWNSLQQNHFITNFDEINALNFLNEVFIRRQLKNNPTNFYISRIDYASYEKKYLFSDNGEMKVFSSFMEVKEYADQKLIEAGFILIPIDKIEQYKVLL